MITLDELGTLYTAPVVDSNGNITTQPTAIEGYHVNSTQAVAEWASYEITPLTPCVVFAGVTTYFYKFASQSAYQTALELIND